MDVLELFEGALDQFELLLVPVTQPRDVLLDGALASLHVGVFGAVLLKLGDFVFGILEAAVNGDLHLLADGVELFEQLVFEVLLILVTLVDINPGDQVGREVDDLFQLLGLQLFTWLDAGEEVGQPRTGTAEVPDVHDGSGELNVAHALTTHLASE